MIIQGCFWLFYSMDKRPSAKLDSYELKTVPENFHLVKNKCSPYADASSPVGTITDVPP